MEISDFEERYKSMSTDELLHIYVSGDLVETALIALQAEFERRAVTSNEIAQAKTDSETISRLENRPAKRSTKIIVNILGVLVTTIILLVFVILKKGVLH